MQIAVDGIVETLRGVLPPQFRPGEVCRRLRDVQLDPKSLAPYLLFAPRRYTRNLIYRDDLFELIALCWEPHTESPIHNHSGQLCWLSIQAGALRLENFHPLEGPESGIRIVPKGCVERAAASIVDLRQGDNGLHRVSNPFDARAVSLHVYSRPYDSCLAYHPTTHAVHEMRLAYHSVGGKLVDKPGRAEARQ